MITGLWPVAYRAGAIASGFRSGGAALGVGAAGGAALISAHPDARGAATKALSEVKAPSATDTLSAVTGAAAGFATQAALTSLGAIARGALRLSPAALAAYLLLELLSRFLKSSGGQVYPLMFPANWSLVCGTTAGRFRGAGNTPQCANTFLFLPADPAWDRAAPTAITVSWKVPTATPLFWSEVGHGVRVTPGAVPRVPIVVPYPRGDTRRGRAMQPPEARTRVPPLVRTIDPHAVRPGEPGDGVAPLPIPWPLIPAIRPNPFRAPLEQRQRGYADPRRARARDRVVDAYIPTDRHWSRPIADAIPIIVQPGEQFPGVVVRPPIAVVINPARPGARTRPIAPGHVFARAKAGTKEVKVKMSMHPKSPQAKMVHLVTETEDFIEALWDSIPENCKRNAGYNFKNIEDKVEAIWRFMGTPCLPWEAALQNLVVEKATDMVFGAAGRAQAQANQTFGWIRSPLWMSQLNGGNQ